MQYNEFLELLSKRRSNRRVKPDPIPDEMVHYEKYDKKNICPEWI